MTGTQKSYDLGPKTYARWRATPLGALTEDIEHALVLNLAGDVSGKKVLDVGCGDGALAVKLAKKGAKVTGVDINPEMLAAASRAARETRVKLDLKEGNGENLPFADHQFDLVFVITLLCFVRNPPKVFEEVHRVLKPGGRIIIGELGKWSLWAFSRRVRGWLGSPTWRGVRFWSAKALLDLAEKAGFSPGLVRGSVFYPPLFMFARALAFLDRPAGRAGPFGAAFLVLLAEKPEGR